MRLKALFLENLPLKIASLLFATLLWFFVVSGGKTEKNVSTPLEFKNIPPSLQLVGELPKSIDVWVQGHEGTLKRLKGDEVKTSIDLSGGKEGDSTFYLNPQDVKAPFNIKVTKVSPSSIRLRLEQTIKKTVEVKALIVGKPAHGFRLRKIEVQPRHLTVEGVRRDVETLRFLRTEPIDITGSYQDFTYDGRIDTSGKDIRIQLKDLKVRVFIAREGR